jgi:Zn-dependent protease with chaperone function
MFQTFMADGVHAALASAGGWLIAFAQSAAPVAVAALWQGTAIALVLWVCLGLTSRAKIHIGAAQRFGLWAAAFAVVVGLEFLPWLLRGAKSVIAVNALPGASAVAPRFQIDDRWAIAIAALWLTASLVRAVTLAVQSLRLRRLWNSASPVAADAKLLELLGTASPTRRGNSRKVAELCTTRMLDRPSVIGFLAPRILIPEGLFARLTPGELEQVVLHETEHLRRRDDWSNLFQKLALVLFPLNPALAWIENRLCREREMACDEGVVRRTQAPRAYAECLTSLAERRLELRLERRRAHALSLGAFERRPELVGRVYSILARKQALHPVAARVLVGVAGCGLLVASVELARCPQMVAFVPAVQTATPVVQMARAGSAPRRSDGDRALAQPTVARNDSMFRMPGFRVVDTKAIPPTRNVTAPLSPAASRRAVTPSADRASAAQRELATTNANAPREVLLRTEMPDADAGPRGLNSNSGFAGEPQYVVLTAWEVQTSPRRDRIVADYDTNPSAPPQSSDASASDAQASDVTASAAPDQTTSHAVAQITITQLIIAVYPMRFEPSGSGQDGSGQNGSGLNGPGPRSEPIHAPDSDRPRTPLPVSGWLVFQL